MLIFVLTLGSTSLTVSAQEENEEVTGSFTDEGQQVDYVGWNDAYITNDGKTLNLTTGSRYLDMDMYVTKDGKHVKLLYKEQLYNYNFDTNLFTLEHTFDKSTSNNSLDYCSQDVWDMDSFLDYDNGILYYANNYYHCVYAKDQKVKVVAYDLNSGSVIKSFETSGINMESVGVDKNGRVYISSNNTIQTGESYNSTTEYTMSVFGTNGSKLCHKKLTYEVEEFLYFKDNGEFFVGEVRPMYNNALVLMTGGLYSNNTITLSEDYHFSLSNKLFNNGRYVDFVDDKYILEQDGNVYFLEDEVEPSEYWAERYGIYRDDRYNDIGSGMAVVNGELYASYDNNVLYSYDLQTGKQKNVYVSDQYIATIIPGKDCLIAFKSDCVEDVGYVTNYNFWFEKIDASKFTKVSSNRYVLNDLPKYKNRTKNEITQKFADSTPYDYYTELFSQVGSYTAPYKEYVFTDDAKKESLALANYYRWLGGLSGFGEASEEWWTYTSKGVVLLSKSGLTHLPDQPSDMDEEFYNEGYYATSNSNIGHSSDWYVDKYELVNKTRGYISDTNNMLPDVGHRATFLNRNNNEYAFAIGPHYSVQYAGFNGDYKQLNNNDYAYAWPAAGTFPAEELKMEAYWSVDFDAKQLNPSRSGLTVTITNLDTKEKFVRDTKSGTARFQGGYESVVFFDPPEFQNPTFTYDGTNFKVEISGLTNSDGMPAIMEYTINFFSYKDVKLSGDGKTYTINYFGEIQGSDYEKKVEVDQEILKSLPDVKVSYCTHIQTYGWEGPANNTATWKSDGQMSGTSGQAKRLEGIRIAVAPKSSYKDFDLGITYTTHCQRYGWLGWTVNGEMNGTEGEAKRLEAISINLTGEHSKYYDVYYRVHAQTYGWLGWAKNGNPAGTAGYAKRLEGIQIVVVKKGVKIDANMGGIVSNNQPYISKDGVMSAAQISNQAEGRNDVGLIYTTHVQTYGWQEWQIDGSTAGTFGEAKRLEAIKILKDNCQYDGDVIYTTHVQTYGWQGKLDDQSTWKKNGELCGTSGERKRLEAICIDLTGEMGERYDIYYRVHAQTFGWLPWAKNGEPAGTAGYGKRLEAIQIEVRRKNIGPPEAHFFDYEMYGDKPYLEKK